MQIKSGFTLEEMLHVITRMDAVQLTKSQESFRNVIARAAMRENKLSRGEFVSALNDYRAKVKS